VSGTMLAGASGLSEAASLDEASGSTARATRSLPRGETPTASAGQEDDGGGGLSFSLLGRPLFWVTAQDSPTRVRSVVVGQEGGRQEEKVACRPLRQDDARLLATDGGDQSRADQPDRRRCCLLSASCARR
jgi:hypothetical protein